MSSIVLSIFLLSIGASFIQRTTGFGFGSNYFSATLNYPKISPIRFPFFAPVFGETAPQQKKILFIFMNGLFIFTNSLFIFMNASFSWVSGL